MFRPTRRRHRVVVHEPRDSNMFGSLSIKATLCGVVTKSACGWQMTIEECNCKLCLRSRSAALRKSPPRFHDHA